VCSPFLSPWFFTTLGAIPHLKSLPKPVQFLPSISRLQSLRFLDTCLSDTTTNTITTLGNRIADQVLTPRLRDKFAQEIINLAGYRVRVEMVRAGGQYGSPHYQVRLLAAPNVNVAGVLSEGEQTCVAIAAFLAELATASHASALTFDDPISSLDHKWRDRVAKRLVEEASVRQVAVFTHDLIFLNDIEEAAEHAGVPCETRYVRQTAAGAGIVNADLPWDGMKLPARVQKLQESVQSLARTRPQADEETYERDARHFYDDLRAAWERALEEVAFAQVVMRHRDQIKPAPLLKVTVLTEQIAKSGRPIMPSVAVRWPAMTNHAAVIALSRSRTNCLLMPRPSQPGWEVSAIGKSHSTNDRRGADQDRARANCWTCFHSHGHRS
jgi:AAA domain